MYTNPVNYAAAAPASGTTTTSSTSSSDSTSGTGLDSMFMQLLVTQLQNQDPLSPMDPSTFVTQLVGVNSLDQLTQINQLLQSTLSS